MNWTGDFSLWLNVLAVVLILGFAVASMVCISGIANKKGMIIESRTHKRLSAAEVLYANLGLVALAVLLHFQIYNFSVVVAVFVAFILLSTKLSSGLSLEGAVIGAHLIAWDDMVSYKFTDNPDDSNIILVKIKAEHRQYVLVFDRSRREDIQKIFEEKNIAITEVSKELTREP